MIFIIITILIQLFQVIGYRSKCVNIPGSYLMEQLEGDRRSLNLVDGIMTPTAINYDGSDYVDMGSTTIGGQISLHFWVNYKQIRAHSRFMDFATFTYPNGNGNTDAISIGSKATTDGMRCIIQDDSDTASEINWDGGGIYTLNQWDHFVVNVGTNKSYQIYKNGVDITSTSDVNTSAACTTDIPVKTRPFSRFGKANVNKQPLKAYVDEMTLYNRVLTYEEVLCGLDTCSYQCSTCSESYSNCLTCAGNRTGAPTCGCPSGKYEASAEQVTCSGNCITGCDVCSNSSTCTTCISGSHRSGSNCDCDSGYYDSGATTCASCDFPCTQCSGSASNCTSCENSSPARTGSSCTCPSNYYSQGTTAQCQQCVHPCQNCTSSSVCTSCVSSSPSRSGSSCTCPNGYYNQGTTSQCQTCQHPCQNCSSSTVCTSCVSSTPSRTGSSCQCPNGYYGDGSTSQCQSCQHPCANCSNLSTCTSCVSSSPSRQGSTCACPQYYYNSGTTAQCQSCVHPCLECTSSNTCTSCVSSTNARTGSNCVCPQQYYDDGSTAECQSCLWQCLTCQNNTQCQSCKVSSTEARVMPLCGCPDEYYDDGSNEDCQSCLLRCQVCVNGTSCQTCTSGTNRSGSTCQCDDGYYDDLSNANCVQCPYPCLTCNSTQCLTCIASTPSRVGNSCDCPDGYYNQGTTAQCQQCQFPCINCTSSSNCTSCVVSSPVRTTNQCICDDQYYDDGSTAQCQDCLIGCQTCLNNISCQSCKTSTPSRSGSTCLCPSKYFDDGTNDNCQQCILGCDVCDNASTCITCISNSYRINSDCACQGGYFNTGAEICQSCDYQCATCVTSSSNCQTCSDSNRSLTNSPSCSCDDGYIEQGVNNPVCAACKYNCNGCTSTYDNCTLCKGLNRNTDQPTCSCQVNYYDDGINSDCVQCNFIGCDTCDSSICLTCIGDQFQDYSRKINNTTGNLECICPDKYYHLTGFDNCQACQQQCGTCVNTDDNCLTCKGNRIQQPDCICPYHQYDDESEDCKECQETCESCDKDECLECRTNRQIQGASSKDCYCLGDDIDHFSENPSTLWCTSCTVGVFVATFTEDYSQINVVFYDDVYINGFDQYEIFSKSLCIHVIDMDFYGDQLGDIPQCRLYNNREFQIKLGRGPTILKDDDIIILPNTIGRNACITGPTYFTDFPTTTIYQHENSLPPSVELNNPTSSISLCQDISIQISKILYDGGRGLSSFQWSIISSTASDITNLQTIFDQTNTNGLSFLNIPALTLKEYSEYKIILQFQNFVGLDAVYSFTLYTSSSKGAFVEIDQINPFVFKNWKTNQIDAQIQYLDCSSGSFTEVQQDLVVTWDDITDSNNPIPLENYSTSDKLVSRYIEPYTSVPGTTYTIEIKVNVDGFPDLEASQYVDYLVEISPLIVYIEGGNRLHAYAQPLELVSIGRDPDVPVVDQELDLTRSWSCLNLGLQSPCESIDGNILQFNSTNTAYFEQKIFEPYNSYQYTFTVDKQDKDSRDGLAIIIIVETDLPLLSVQVPENMLQNKINKNDDLQVDINFDGDYNEVFISLIFLYKYEVVATKSFDFPSFAFKIWDHFNNFDSDEINFLLRVSLYDPNYFMPSQTTFSVAVNFEPKASVMSVTPQSGIALVDEFVIQLTGFYDEDQPLSYKYQYYTSYDDYLQEKLGGSKQIQLNKNTIVDFTNENSLITKLPKGTYNQDNGQTELLIMVSVSDSLGAITNVTQTIQVQNDPSSDFQSYLNIVQNQLDNLETFSKDNKIQLLNIMASDISRQGVQNCMNNCSGNGVCDQVKLECQCNDGYFLNDCSQYDQNLLQDFINIQKSVYDQLNLLQSQIPYKVIQDQVMKSLNILMKNGYIGMVLSQEEIDSNIENLASTVDTQLDELSNIVNQNLINQGDSLSTRQYTQITEILGKTIENIDSIFKTFNENENRRRQLNEEDINQSQQNLVSIQKNINEAFQKAQLPNSDPLSFEGQNLKCVIQKLTSKKIEQQFFKDESQNTISGFMDQENNEETEEQQQTSGFDENQEDTNSIYKSSINSYKNNPYVYETEFPYQDQNLPVNDVDIENEAVEGSEIETSQNITMDFSSVGDNTDKNVCISKTDKGSWDNQECTTVENELDNGEISIKCQCKSLSPATVINDLDDMFSESLTDEVFGDEGFDALAEFDFWNSIIFYIFLFKTIVVILSIIYGIKQDKIDEKQEMQFKEEYEQYKKQKEQEQEKEVEKDEINDKDQNKNNLNKSDDETNYKDNSNININFIESQDVTPKNQSIFKRQKNKMQRRKNSSALNSDESQQQEQIQQQIKANENNDQKNETNNINNEQEIRPYKVSKKKKRSRNRNSVAKSDSNNDTCDGILASPKQTPSNNQSSNQLVPSIINISAYNQASNAQQNNMEDDDDDDDLYYTPITKRGHSKNSDQSQKTDNSQQDNLIENQVKSIQIKSQDVSFNGKKPFIKDKTIIQQSGPSDVLQTIEEVNNESKINSQLKDSNTKSNSQLSNQSYIKQDSIINDKNDSKIKSSQLQDNQNTHENNNDGNQKNQEKENTDNNENNQNKQNEDVNKNDQNNQNDNENQQDQDLKQKSENNNSNSNNNSVNFDDQEITSKQSKRPKKKRNIKERAFLDIPIMDFDDNSSMNSQDILDMESQLSSSNNRQFLNQQQMLTPQSMKRKRKHKQQKEINNSNDNLKDMNSQNNQSPEKQEMQNSSQNPSFELSKSNNEIVIDDKTNEKLFQKKFQTIDYQEKQRKMNSLKFKQFGTLDDSKPIPKDRLKDVSEGIIKLHDFFGIFIVFHSKLTRPQRFILYYLKTSLLLAVSSLFCQSLNQVQSVILSVLSTIVTGVPSAIISKLFKKKKTGTSILAVIVFMAFQLTALYVSLTVAALLGVDKSNEWVISYFTSFTVELFILDPIKTMSKLLMVRKSLIKGKKNCIVKFLADKEILNFLKNKKPEE